MKIKKENFEIKKYSYESNKFSSYGNIEYKENQKSKYKIEKLQDLKEEFFDLGVYEYDLEIESHDNFRRRFEELILSILCLRVDNKFNVYEILNKDLIEYKLDVIEEMSKRIDFIDRDFSMLKFRELLSEEDTLRIAIENYKFCEVFFCEIYNKFEENFHGRLVGKKYLTDIIKTDVIPLELTLDKLENRKYCIMGELDFLEMGEHRLIESLNKEFSSNIKKIDIYYKKIIELDEFNIPKNIEKTLLISGNNNFNISKKITIKEV